MFSIMRQAGREIKIKNWAKRLPAASIAGQASSGARKITVGHKGTQGAQRQ
jgi:hypothetical protein